MSFPKKVRNFRTKTGRTFPNSSGKIEDAEFATFTSLIAETLRDAFGNNRAAAKSIMRITGAGERTVKNWLEGKNSPSSENLIELVHHSDEVLEVFLLIAGRHEILTMKNMVSARDALVEMISFIDELVSSEFDDSG
jgi:hypothetical protein